MRDQHLHLHKKKGNKEKENKLCLVRNMKMEWIRMYLVTVLYFHFGGERRGGQEGGGGLEWRMIGDDINTPIILPSPSPMLKGEINAA